MIARKDWINARQKPSRHSTPPYLAFRHCDDIIYIPVDFNSLAPVLFSVTIMSCVLGQLYSVSIAIIGKCLTFLVSPISWSLHRDATSPTACSGAPGKKSVLLAMCCLCSTFFEPQYKPAWSSNA